MKVICLKYFQHISKIIQIIQPNLISKTKNQKMAVKISKNDNFNREIELDQQLENLKLNVENLLRYCQSLENQNKNLKRNSSTLQISERDSYKIVQGPPFLKKSFSNTQINPDNLIKIEKQNQQLRQTRELYLDSLNKIHSLKNEVQNLKQKLNKMSEIYEKSDQTSLTNLQKHDMFMTEKSLMYFSHEPIQQQDQQTDLQYLLCHQDLNIEDSILKQQGKQNMSQKINKGITKQEMIDNLIQKGISYKQTQSLKNKQFEGLNHIIEKYRSESNYENVRRSNQDLNASLKSVIERPLNYSIKFQEFKGKNLNEIYQYR